MDNYSVLMSVYDGEKPEYFKESIESMLGQTLPPEQIVIVKDGPLTKDLDEVLKKYLDKHPDIFTVVSLKDNVGLGKALNKGLEYCRNELVARMDTDDISVKERCEIQVKEFQNNNNLDILGSYIGEFNENPKEILSKRIVPLNHYDIIEFSKRRNPFNHPTVMYKKSVILKHGGYKDYRRNQDLDLFVRLLLAGNRAKNINESLVLFRANDDNLKRRKSWSKCKSYIQMIYNFWRKGHSSFVDLFIVASSQILVYLAPSFFLNWISKVFLRKQN